MKTIVSLKELMTRWGVSRASITRMEQAGTLQRLRIPGIFYSIKNVLAVENIDEKEFTPFELRRLRNELRQTQKELKRCRMFISEMAVNMSQFEYEERRERND